jgi:hypothetical protein
MASTHLKNSFQTYCQDQTRQARQYEIFVDKKTHIRSDICIPDLGIITQGLKGGYNNNVLSNNTADIESNLFGIGSTNLAKPKSYKFNPSINNRNSCEFFTRPSFAMPRALNIDSNQRPLGPFS